MLEKWQKSDYTTNLGGSKIPFAHPKSFALHLVPSSGLYLFGVLIFIICMTSPSVMKFCGHKIFRLYFELQLLLLR